MLHHFRILNLMHKPKSALYNVFAGSHMAGRLLKVSSVATAVFASSGFYLYSKDIDLNDLSIIRFGRAAVTVNISITS